MFCMSQADQYVAQNDSTVKKIENYIFKYEDILGRGNFGSAYRGYDVNTGMSVAIKVIAMASIKSGVTEKLLENEIETLKLLPNHSNLLKCFDVFTSVNNCYIITELCQTDLAKELEKRGRFMQHEIKGLVYGIYKGLEEMGKNSIVHRDVKTSNVFLTKNKTPKIADFGFAVKSQGKFKDINIGSPLYMSPEGLIDHVYGPKTDVWSFGVMLYELLHGETPLQKCTKDDQLKAQVLQPVRLSAHLSPEMRQLLAACLTVDEARRPDIFELANLAYMRRLLKEFERNQISLKESGLGSTEGSEETIEVSKNRYFFKKELSYETALSLLHYCRLLHKANRKVLKSQGIGQFIVNLSESLSRCRIGSSNTFNQQLTKLRHVLEEYHSKFVVEYGDSKILVNPRQVLREIEVMKLNPLVKQFLNVVEMFQAETVLFIGAIEQQNASYFAARSKAKDVIENQAFNW